MEKVLANFSPLDCPIAPEQTKYWLLEMERECNWSLMSLKLPAEINKMWTIGIMENIKIAIKWILYLPV